MNADQVLRVYRRSPATNLPEQIHCRIVDQNAPAFDCGPFVRGAVTVVEGVFTVERVPDQIVGDSTGRIEVIKYRDSFYVLID